MFDQTNQMRKKITEKSNEKLVFNLQLFLRGFSFLVVE
jgi:hypothetical protein